MSGFRLLGAASSVGARGATSPVRVVWHIWGSLVTPRTAQDACKPLPSRFSVSDAHDFRRLVAVAGPISLNAARPTRKENDAFKRTINESLGDRSAREFRVANHDSSLVD